MGIKELFNKKYCAVCGIKIPYAWKYCREHGPEVRKAKIIIEDYRDALRMFKIHQSINKKNLIDKEYLIVDENGLVIGYK